MKYKYIKNKCLFIGIIVAMSSIYTAQTNTSGLQAPIAAANQATDIVSSAGQRKASYYNSTNNPLRLTFYYKTPQGQAAKAQIEIPVDKGRSFNIPKPIDRLVIEDLQTNKKDVLDNGSTLNPTKHPEINWYDKYYIATDRITPWRNFRLQNIVQRGASLFLQTPGRGAQVAVRALPALGEAVLWGMILKR